MEGEDGLGEAGDPGGRTIRWDAISGGLMTPALLETVSIRRLNVTHVLR